LAAKIPRPDPWSFVDWNGSNRCSMIRSGIPSPSADVAITAVTANDLGTLGNGENDFAAVPAEGALTSYLRDNPTAYYYCWDATGKAKQLAAADPCPAGPY
jgi:hypothetical protein